MSTKTIIEEPSKRDLKPISQRLSLRKNIEKKLLLMMTAVITNQYKLHSIKNINLFY